MKMAWFVKILVLICAFAAVISAQNTNQPKIESQEIDESDGIPVLIKHLPDWENTRNRATYILNGDDLRKSLGTRPIFDLIDFTGGAEAVTAQYDAGKLLIIEYNSPETSIETDTKIKQSLIENTNNPPIFYRRIGNYNAFIFDGNNETVANALLDQIKYEKMVQWLGKDPYAQQRAERNYLLATGELIFTTVLMIVGGFGSAVLAGIVFGIAFYYIREQKRNQTQIYTDAGGMTRLNLDGLTSDDSSDKLLN
ncbi:MAG TPA: hypothetical protein PKE69_03125 [Pyrinomonadaceae bacterium]|nr:hypothetical protein [Pyrinomonadaceae bacterium]